MGDTVFVTGWPGRASAGRQLLQAGHALTSRTAIDETARGNADAAVQACLRAFLDPSPPVLFGAHAAAHVGAMMDVSDGLAIDLGRMCRASSVGALLSADALLADPVLELVAADFEIDVEACVLHGGDDYELLGAVSEGEQEVLRAAAVAAGIETRTVGRFVADPTSIFVERDGACEPLPPDGWDHFAKCP